MITTNFAAGEQTKMGAKSREQKKNWGMFTLTPPLGQSTTKKKFTKEFQKMLYKGERSDSGPPPFYGAMGQTKEIPKVFQKYFQFKGFSDFPSGDTSQPGFCKVLRKSPEPTPLSFTQ
jgi:hypothetical protein